jgi:hypothetical protein
MSLTFSDFLLTWCNVVKRQTRHHPGSNPKASQLTGSAAVTEWITQERRKKTPVGRFRVEEFHGLFLMVL